MHLGEFFEGVGLAAWGAGFYAGVRWLVGDDARMRRLAQSRWSFDSRAARRVRSGELSREEWFDHYTRSQRQLVKWFITPAMVVWFALCASTVVHGILSR